MTRIGNLHYTRGPWYVDDDGHVAQPGNQFMLAGRICLLTDPSHPSARADAKLIAAAPEMIEALLAIVEDGCTLQCKDDSDVPKLLAAALNKVGVGLSVEFV